VFGDKVGSHDRASLEMHWEAVIERVWSYALRGHDRVNLESVIERVWRCTSAKCKSVWKPHANLPDTPVDLTGAPK